MLSLPFGIDRKVYECNRFGARTSEHDAERKAE